jgi:ATP-dependent DNA helicase RecG
MPLPEAVRAIHFPEDEDRLARAVTRLKFGELFLYQLLFAQVRKDRVEKAARALPVHEAVLKQFTASLPFPLTNAQRRAAWDIVQDMSKPRPMNRLLEGDVGSGKTVVAGIAAVHTAAAGFCSAYLAPTEILALQQYETFHRWTKGPVVLLTSAQAKLAGKDVSRSEAVKFLKTGKVSCVLGTHALFQETVVIPNLALVIVDEQHRFGVEQRHALLDRDPAPHLLSMTATPIPRSLSLTLYGDLDLSVLNQLPAGRKPVATKVVGEGERSGMWTHVRQEIGQGRQAYVVCPLIDPSDAMGSKSVKEMEASLKVKDLLGVRLGVLHGKMKSTDKDFLLNQFCARKIDVLISTTVVEVGVNVPNATIMVIVGAERFGLAQLHQLRGRVGRSDLQSYCYVLSDDPSSKALARLRLFETTHDGFALAEKDLELRGSGNIFGTSQSGFPEFKLATLADVPLMRAAREWAVRLSEGDPQFIKHPEVGKRVREQLDRVHLE